MVGIAVSTIQYNPGDRPEGLLPEVGSGIEVIPERECRYVQAERINEEAYAIILAIDIVQPSTNSGRQQRILCK